MKFTFRLQTLWKLRSAQRDERQSRLSEALRADDILQARIAEVEAELAQSVQACREASQPGLIDVDRLLITQRYELVLAGQLETIRRQRQQLAAEIERRRQALVEADRQVKVLQKLRERQWAKHQEKERQVENKRLDEIAQCRPRQEQRA